MKILKQPIQFQWDKGNQSKNWGKHRVSDEECEEVFFDLRKKSFKDTLHSHKEPRYILLGKTKQERSLFIAFTIRNKKIRVISARDLKRKERNLYHGKT